MIKRAGGNKEDAFYHVRRIKKNKCMTNMGSQVDFVTYIEAMSAVVDARLKAVCH